MDETALIQHFYKVGYITKEHIEKAFEILQKDRSRNVIDVLFEIGALDDNKLLDFYKKHLPGKIWNGNVEDVEIPENIIKELPEDLLRRNMIAPVSYKNGVLTVITLNPYNQQIINELRFKTRIDKVNAMFAPRRTIEAVLDKLFPTVGKILEDLEPEGEVEIEQEEIDFSDQALLAAADEGPVVKLANAIITEAVKKGASDIHIEPYEKSLVVRYRIDGILRVYHEFKQPSLKASLISRFKIMAGVDISEKRKPQDGRIRLKIDGRRIDLRFSSVPTIHGEKVVMRIQKAESYLNVKLEDLGFEPDDLEKFRKAIWTPWGMVLVTGPTGSGKTTTLYSALMERNTPDVNIMTAEDPVEVAIPGLNQVQINEKAGVDFATVLRAFLRQDPDIILIGEIRDRETAEIGIKAALTGHLVFSTLHTNDAPSSITRLVDMGIEPFLVGSSVILIVAQRLIRKLCPVCKVPDQTPREALVRMGVLKDISENLVIYTHKEGGCEECNYTGYKGRTAVHEILVVDEEIRKLIVKGATAEDIRDLARQKGMRTLYEAGLLKVRKGITSLYEVARVLAK